MLDPGKDHYKYIDLPLSNYGSASFDNGSATWTGECGQASGYYTYSGNVWPEHYSARRAGPSGGLAQK